MEVEERLSEDLQVDVKFEDRAYKLGEAIEVTVDMGPAKDAYLRLARLSLLCRQRWVWWDKPLHVQTIHARTSGRIQLHRQRLAVKDEDIEYALVDVATDRQLRAGRTDPFAVRIRTPDAPPPRAGDAKLNDATHSWTFEWLLVLKIDTRLDKDVVICRKVKVLFD